MSKITKDVRTLLEEVAEMAAVKAVRKKTAQKQGINYFKLTEKILHQYQDLKFYLQDEESYIQKYFDEKPRRSKDIVCYSTGSRQSVVEATELTREKARENLKLSQAFVARIDMALHRLEKKENVIIDELYLSKTSKPEDLAAKMYIDRRTLFRHKKKIIEKIGNLLFGSVSMDI